MTQPRDNPPRSVTEQCKDAPWQCGACDSLLAFVDAATKTEVRVKYKDLFLWFRNADDVKIACRSCGAMNRAERQPEPPAEELADLLARLDNLAKTHGLVAHEFTPIRTALVTAIAAFRAPPVQGVSEVSPT